MKKDILGPLLCRLENLKAISFDEIKHDRKMVAVPADLPVKF